MNTLITELTQEYIMTEGIVNAEFHATEITAEMLAEFTSANAQLKELNSVWSFYVCDTCSENADVAVMHCEIICTVY